MKQRWKVTAGILTAVVCMLFGCEKKSAQGESLLIVPVEENVQAGELDGEEPREELVVHICGAVKQPGVYILKAGSRIYQAIEAAGGFAAEAEEDYLNQADLLTDSMKIYVPTTEEAGEQKYGLNMPGMMLMEQAGQETATELININTASLELLCTLPGVGEGKAQSIITYREEHGNFQNAEEIMKVDGIKDGLFSKIKDKIRV